MLAIVNVSPDDAPNTGINQYEVRVNSQVIATFEHDRQFDGAAQCLRDAADAVEKCSKAKKELLQSDIIKVVNETMQELKL